MEIIKEIFGTGKDLNIHQMSVRAFLMFFITLALIRVAGMRTFGKKSAFDTVITIMLGALLSRVIVGASEFLPTTTAGAVIVIVHRIVAWFTLRYTKLESIVKGEHRLLYKDGKINWHNMNRSSVSETDLMESVRLQANKKSLADIEEAYMESSGEISVIKKD
jgi:uncharacterized membrane protein YcaP (DUF421 family)